MKKRLLMVVLALVLVVLTVYSASAFEVTFDADNEVYALEAYSAQANTTVGVDEVSFELVDPVSGMVIDPNTGLIAWNPTLSQVGEHTIEVKATNDSNDSIYASNSYGLTVMREKELSANDLDLGDSNQEPGEDITQFYEISNLGSHESITAIQISDSVPDEYNFDIDYLPMIGADSSISATVSLTIPEDESSGRKKIGEIVISGEGVDSITKDVYLEIRRGLEIDRVEIRADGKRLETIRFSDYESFYRVDDVKPGSEIEIQVTVRNNLPDSSDNEMRDVELELYSFESDNADGLDAFISRIRSDGDSEEATFRFFIDSTEFRDGDLIDLELNVLGETRDGYLHSDSWDLELEITTERYDLLMSDLSLSSTSLCPGDQLRVDFELINIGSNDLSYAGIRYYSYGLDIDTWDKNLDLDSEDSRRMNKILTIPQDAPSGEFFLEVIAHPRMTSSSDVTSELLSFMIRDCEAQEEEEEEEEEDDVVVIPGDDVVVPGTPVSDATGTKSSIFDSNSNFYLILLTALVVLLLIGVVLLIVSLFR